MSIPIVAVDAKSPAAKAGIQPGSELISINGSDVNDLLDYGFYSASRKLDVAVKTDGAVRHFRIVKSETEPLGIEAESYLMDRQHSCKNNCIFCFIDQLPEGLRPSLYFKDDDERLSFLFGNYITLTNLSDAEAERIVQMRISPVNVSVHTTNPELRCTMMGNRFAGEKLRYLQQFADAGTEINAQLVLCRGVNDGAELTRSIAELARLFPAMASIAVVPVGLTDHRAGLPVLEPFDRDSATEVLDEIARFQQVFREQHGVGLVYPADEWFYLAGREIPPLDYYDELRQLENGVGMVALERDLFVSEIACVGATKPFRGTILTGTLAAPLMTELAALAAHKNPQLQCRVVPVENRFFGKSITVSGLVTAADILLQVKVQQDEVLLIPRNMLRTEQDIFLDSIPVEALSEALQCAILIVNDGAQLARILTGGEEAAW